MQQGIRQTCNATHKSLKKETRYKMSNNKIQLMIWNAIRFKKHELEQMS